MKEKEIAQLLSSRRILTIDGEEQPFFVSPRPLSTEDVEQLRARWKELHIEVHGEGRAMPLAEFEAQYAEIERLRQKLRTVESAAREVVAAHRALESWAPVAPLEVRNRLAGYIFRLEEEIA